MMAERSPSPERDPRLDAAWRTCSTEEPSADLDAAILAAAHREVASRPARVGDDDTRAEAREPSRWWWGLAAAATIGAFAFGLVQLASMGRVDDPTRATDIPPEGVRQAREVPATPRPDVAATRSKEADLADVPTPPHPPPSPRLAPQAAPTLAQVAPAAVERAAAPTPAAPAPPPPMATPPSDAASARTETPLPATRTSLARAGASAESADAAAPAAAEFVRRIRELHAAGRLDDAARELVAFRKAYPDADAQLPPALREWAATVRK